MSDFIRMDYPLMEEMAQAFRNGAEQLEETRQQMESIAQLLEDGALRGLGGDSMTVALRDILCRAIDRLNGKFNELEGDITAAVVFMRDGDTSAESRFL